MRHLQLLLTLALAGFLAFGCNVTPNNPDDDDDDNGDDDDANSIYAIQQGDVGEGDFVTLEGVIVTSPEAEEGFYIQEPEGGEYSGIYVHSYADVLDLIEMEPGQVVTISGTVKEFYDVTELDLNSTDNIEITNTTTPLTPEVLESSALAASVAEPWEGVLVQTSGVVSQGTDNYGVWEVDGNIKVDDVFYHVEPAIDATVEKIAGVLEYSFDEFKILPRDADDVDVEGAGPVIKTIAELNQGLVADNTVVTVEGAVATTGLTQEFSNCEIQGLFLAQGAGAENGIKVIWYLDTVSGVEAVAGNEFDITALYNDYKGSRSLILQDKNNLDKLQDSVTIPVAEVIDSCMPAKQLDAYQGTLVTVEDMTVTQTVADIGFGMFEVDGCLLVSSKFFEFTDCGAEDLTPEPPMSTDIASITGPIDFTYGEYKLEPYGADAYTGWTP